MVRSWVWSSAGVAHHGVADPRDAVPVPILARLAGLVLVMDCRGAGSVALARDTWEELARWGHQVSVPVR